MLVLNSVEVPSAIAANPASPKYWTRQADRNGMTSILSCSHTARLRAQRHDILVEAVRLASAMCDTPEAIVLLKSTSPRMFAAVNPESFGQRILEPLFCAHTMQQSGLFFVEDASRDDRFSLDPIVAGGLGYRMFCGLPLRDVDGACIGTLCVLDRSPRRLLVHQQRGLLMLGQTVQSRLTSLSAHYNEAPQVMAGQRNLVDPSRLPELNNASTLHS